MLVALIGEGWARKFEESKQKNPDQIDFVKFEIELALDLGLPVMPVLIDGAAMPHSNEMPSEIRIVGERNALEVRSGRDFRHHIQGLIDAIIAILNANATLVIKRSDNFSYPLDLTVKPLKTNKPMEVQYRKIEPGAETSIEIPAGRYKLSLHHFHVNRLDGYDARGRPYKEAISASAKFTTHFEPGKQYSLVCSSATKTLGDYLLAAPRVLLGPDDHTNLMLRHE